MLQLININICQIAIRLSELLRNTSKSIFSQNLFSTCYIQNRYGKIRQITCAHAQAVSIFMCHSSSKRVYDLYTSNRKKERKKPKKTKWEKGTFFLLRCSRTLHIEVWFLTFLYSFNLPLVPFVRVELNGDALNSG